jgi:hypothetical protein
VKQALLVAALVVGASNLASAQIIEIHNRFGPSGTHFQLPSDTRSFCYEASITGSTTAYQVVLEVFHNGVLKATNLETVLLPPPVYEYSCPIDMSSWGLRPGDTVTFRVKVVGLTLGKILGSDVLFGDVVSPVPAP